MSKYLINVTETYRVDSEPEVEQILAELKASDDYELSKYSCVQKQLKSKGEIIDDWYRLTLTKVFTSEKEPDRNVTIKYEGDNSYGAF